MVAELKAWVAENRRVKKVMKEIAELNEPIIRLHVRAASRNCGNTAKFLYHLRFWADSGEKTRCRETAANPAPDAHRVDPVKSAGRFRKIGFFNAADLLLPAGKVPPRCLYYPLALANKCFCFK
jgi:hypothetical protein